MALEEELVLTDSVSGPAKKAADALKRVEAASKKAQEALTSKHAQKFGDAFAKIGMAQESANIKTANKQTKAFADSWAKIGLAQAKALGKHDDKAGWLAKGAEEFGHHLVGAFAAVAVAETIIEGFKKGVELVTEGIKMGFEEGGKEERRRTAYRLSLGAEGGKEGMEAAARASKNTKFTETEAQDMMLPLRRAGMSLESAMQAFATSADVEAGGGPKTQEMMEVFQRIQNKGGVDPRMLRAAQINQPEFFKSLASSLKITADEAKKRATEGKVDPQLLMNTLTQAVNKRQGGMAGTGAKIDENTMEARLHKIAALPEEYMKHMVDSPGWDTLKDKLGHVLEQLDPESENGKRIMGRLFEVFNTIADSFSTALQPENLDKFVSAIETVLAVSKGIVSVFAELISEINALVDIASGETISKLLFKGDAVGQKLKSIDDKRRNIQAGHGDAAAQAFIDSQNLSPSEREDLGRLGKKSGSDSIITPGGRSGGGKVINISVATQVKHDPRDGESDASSARRMGEQVGQSAARVMSNEVLMSGG